MRTFRVQTNSLSEFIVGRAPARPSPLDAEAVQRAAIPQSQHRPGYTGARAGSTLKTPAIYTAARCQGFRYPNQFKAPGPGGFWVAKNAKPSKA